MTTPTSPQPPVDIAPDAGPRVAYRREPVPDNELLQTALAVETRAAGRRSVRQFSDRPVPRAVVESLLRTASSAPSGANLQPWTFVAVQDAATKQRIRDAAEEEERRTYTERMSEEWRRDLQKIGTNWRKPFLTTAPWIIVLFAQRYGITASGDKRRHYYVKESVGLAAGTFIAAANELGLSTLTHTPSPMGFLATVLGRPKNESAFLLLPLGWPAADCTVPDIQRKGLDEVAVFI
jgi:nitroreductase